MKYDIIGDIHGHGSKLISLLESMGYIKTDKGYKHESRKVIFLGDFIDRGEKLKEHKIILNIVMDMVNNDNALAIMGNHEFNALSYHTYHNGKYLREHSFKNTTQHQAFLNEFDNDLDMKKKVLDFFWSLPLFLEIDGIRAIHACWDQQYVDYIKETTQNNRITKEILIQASIDGTNEFNAIERLLKGAEFNLPNGLQIKAKDGTERNTIRLKWWKNEAKKIGDIVLSENDDLSEIKDIIIDNHIPRYKSTEVPCFIGHYWFSGEPNLIAKNLICLDYSVAKGGDLIAYRYNGEATLNKDNIRYVK